ncbi:MAG: DNA alkylation repair protein [Coriobacteriales bacterium]|nr:DNA alkylation repair protein [Coriobacteriales bacterium]
MTKIQQMLKELSDDNYAKFQAKLTPTIDPKLFIGVRVPKVRKLAKEIKDTKLAQNFITKLPHKYYDENMLHGLLLSEIKDYDECIKAVDLFLPYVDNWAVCDIMSPKIFKKNRQALIKKIPEWISSNATYTCRFGIEMLMSHYLDEDFKSSYLRLPAKVKSNEYYVNMMIAWFFATALAKQWEATIPYIEKKKLPVWVHNKTIQKAIESYRITDEQKNYLRTFKIK